MEQQIEAFEAALQDALMVEGDVRGELMALHDRVARGERTPLVERRIAQLIVRHGKELLGPLAKVLTNVEFERGDPVTASLRVFPKALPETLDDRRWQTLRALDVASCRWPWLVGDRLRRGARSEEAGRLGELFDSCRSLTAVRGLTSGRFPEKACRRIESAEVNDVALARVFDTFPALRHLTWRSIGEVPWEHPAVQTLETFTLGARWDRSLTWSNRAVRVHTIPDELELISVERGPSFERLEVPEDFLSYPQEPRRLFELFEAARARGAAVVLVRGEREQRLPPAWR